MDTNVRKRRKKALQGIACRLKRTVSAALLCAVLLTQTAQAAPAPSIEALARALECRPDSLLTSEKIVPGDAVSDWIALVTGLSGQQGGTYLQRLEAYVTDQYAQQGALDRVKPTEWHRISLTVLALGGDPTAFGKDTNEHPINLIADGTYDWHTTDSPGIQGLNAWIYALLTLDAKAYAVPAGAAYPRSTILQTILSAQEPDGSFGLTRGHGNVDITAMALQALSPYANGTTRYPSSCGKESTVGEAVDRALTWLHEQQASDGSFGNSCSTAQVVLALCCLGIAPSQFAKNGHSAEEALLSFMTSDGLFRYLPTDTEYDLMSTEQAFLALTAMERLSQGQRRIFDFRGEREPALSQEIRSVNEDIAALTKSSPPAELEALDTRYRAIPAEERSYVSAYPLLAQAMTQAGLPLAEEDPVTAYDLTPPTTTDTPGPSAPIPWLMAAGAVVVLVLGAVILSKKGTKHHV